MVVDGNALKELSSLENNGRECPVLILHELYELAHMHHAQHLEPVKADDTDHVYPVASIVLVEPYTQSARRCCSPSLRRGTGLPIFG
jgi:hypothetical protein